MIKEEQLTEMNKLINKMKRISSSILIGILKGDYDKALKNIEQGEQLIKRIQGDSPEEIKELHSAWLAYRATIYAFKGDLILCLKDANELLNVARMYRYNRGISMGTIALGRYYWLSGDLDTALTHSDRAIRISEENLNNLTDFMSLSEQLYVATRISVDKEDLERAKMYFKRLEEIREQKAEDLIIKDVYRLAKAFLLKTSMRSRDRVMAEDEFRKIIEEGGSQFSYKLRALYGLCELLLEELKISNDISIISEIKPLLEELIGIAQHSGLNYWLIEAYILHGKLALVIFDMEGSQRYLTQARNMAESFGYIGLADEITKLHEAMMEKKDTWEQMEKREAPISERMDLARLDDHLKGKFRRLMMRLERVDDTPPKKEVF